MRKINPRLKMACISLYLLLFDISIALAKRKEEYFEEEESKSFLFTLLRGGFGTFIIIFMGFGGMGTIFMTRQGKSATKVPMLGIVMMLIAMTIFALRVMVNAGMFGHEHIRW